MDKASLTPPALPSGITDFLYCREGIQTCSRVRIMMKPRKIITDNYINSSETDTGVDLVCLSHLRWDFVYQRPQHLLSRFAKEGRVFFIEEPTFGDGPMHLDVTEREGGVRVVVPRLPKELLSEGALDSVQRGMIDRLF